MLRVILAVLELKNQVDLVEYCVLLVQGLYQELYSVFQLISPQLQNHQEFQRKPLDL